MKNARAYLFSMAFPRVGVAARPLLATGWPIVATRARATPGTRAGHRPAASAGPGGDRVRRMDAP